MSENPQHQYQKNTEAALGAHSQKQQKAARNLDTHQPSAYPRQHQTANDSLKTHPAYHAHRAERQKEMLKEKQAVLNKPEPDHYKGHDTAREYDKFIGREYEQRGAKAFDTKQKIMETDRKAYTALRSAGHHNTDVEKTIGQRSLNTFDASQKHRQEYGRHVGDHTKHTPQAMRDMHHNQTLRARHNMQGDKRLQSVEVAKRLEAIDKQENIYNAERVHNPKAVSSGEIYRSNYGVRCQYNKGESGERRDTQLAKSHVDDKPGNIPHATSVVKNHSPHAAQHYAPKKQHEYAESKATQAYREQQHEQRPDHHREANRKYASSESYYQNQRQAYYQQYGSRTQAQTQSHTR